MSAGIVEGAKHPQISWLAADERALYFGPKGARLLALPRPWVPPFALFSADVVSEILAEPVPVLRDQIVALGAMLSRHTGKLILRSSILDETIWDRGTFLSEQIDLMTVRDWPNVVEVIKRIVGSAKGRPVALVLQAYIEPEESGEFGNLLRLSKTRDHWEYSIRGRDQVTTTERFNSQRDTAPSTSSPLTARPGLSRARLFASVAAWANNELVRGTNDRVSFEWVRSGETFYIVQLDREDEDAVGVNPMALSIEPSVGVGVGGAMVQLASSEDRLAWDKLAVLDELYDQESSFIPSLFVVQTSDCTEQNRATLAQEFERAFVKNVVVRTSVRAGAAKRPNLGKTDCLSPDAAAAWCINQAKVLKEKYPSEEFAFIAHRYIGARAAAWARAAPGSPVVEIHGTWGLPDALQFCPYDIWDVHVPTETITEYPAHKSNVLLMAEGGTWKYERVKNEIARFQCLSRTELLEVASRTADISARLERPCHVMWFIGCRDGEGRDRNIPWYWVEAHDVDVPEKRNYQVFRVTDASALRMVPSLKARHANLAIGLEPRSQELLRDNDFLKAVADCVVPLGVPVILAGSTLAHAYFQLAKHGCTVIPGGDKDHVRSRRQVNFGKIVRDKIPARIEAQKEKQVVATVPDQARFGYLIGKIIEEALEVREARQPEERLVEFADVYEVLRALVGIEGVRMEDVETSADAKRAKAGGFDDGRILVGTSLPSSADASVSPTNTDAPSPFIQLVEKNTIKVPFAFFGFAEIGRTWPIRVDESGVLLNVVLRQDGIEITASSLEHQLDLDI